jgi:hypothetical protein
LTETLFFVITLFQTAFASKSNLPAMPHKKKEKKENRNKKRGNRTDPVSCKK